MRLFLLLVLFTIITPAYAQFHINNFKAGYYYDNKGNKVIGKIEKYAIYTSNQPQAGRSILFKTDTGKRDVFLKDIISFVIEKDSFTVAPVSLTAYRVLLNTRLKLYEVRTIVGSYSPGVMTATGTMTGGTIQAYK